MYDIYDQHHSMSDLKQVAASKAVEVVKSADGKCEFKHTTKPVPQAGKGQIVVRVEACGLCHSDCFCMYGGASSYPRVPGTLSSVTVCACMEVLLT